ncbi:hypothetical protein D3C72_1819490 [compost metagenome]
MAIETIILSQVRLFAHPQTFDDPDRPLIGSIEPGKNAVAAHLVKPLIQHRLHGFAGITFTGISRAEDITDLGL